MDSVVSHAEADVTLCRYMLKPVVEDTDVFVLSVHWASRNRVTSKTELEV